MRMSWMFAVVASVVLGAPAAGLCADAPPSPPAKTVVLTRLVVKMPAGTQWFSLQKGMFCTPSSSQVWNGAQSEMTVAPVLETFRREFKAGGLTPEAEASLFDPAGASPSEYALAGVVVDEHVDLCAPDTSVANVNKVKGTFSMTIDWQLYSRLRKQVVATAHTTGSFASRDVVQGGLAAFVNGAFAANIQQLTKNADIRKELSGAALAEGELVKPPTQPPLTIPGALGVSTRPIERSAESVVVIYAGNSLGSGVLISKDGYVLTGAHVVGDAREVRLRWADGKDGVASVVRVSKERDVALLKGDAGGRPPLPLRIDMPEVGSTVFAIGAPEGQRFEGTVTRGVVSASRVFQGFTYIQSDVTTGHGGSGGPLIDELGRVVGLTEMGTHNQTSSGISLFTPIRDAVSFLALDLH
jgi:serine protease Do